MNPNSKILANFKVTKSSIVQFSEDLNFSIKTLALTLKQKSCVLIVHDQALTNTSYFKQFKDAIEMNQASKLVLKFFPVPAGEGPKSLAAVSQLLEIFVELTKGFSRFEIAMVAVGGGSIGDLVGFAASVLKRGVTLVQIPTTYLAAVDSAHGGKTAVNAASSKNQIGTLHAPELTLIDRQFFQSLSVDQLESALGEIFKMALLRGGRIWSSWRKFGYSRDADKIADFIWQILPMVVGAKLAIVEQDFEERADVRIQLNLGHTLGHAIELKMGVPHGKAVFVGCLFAVHVSRKMNVLSEKSMKAIRAAAESGKSDIFKFPEPSVLIESMRYDKKSKARDRIQLVLLEAPGRVVTKELPLTKIKIYLESFIREF